jgi:hypothetical protein
MNTATIKCWTDPEDRLLARSIFATDDVDVAEDLIVKWAAEQGFVPASVSNIELSVGAAVTVTLSGSNEKIFVKVWPATVDALCLAAQMQLQAAMAARGFPAPRILTKISALGSGWAVGMGYQRAGVATDVRVPGVRQAMAVGLARFVAEAEPCRSIENLPRRLLPPDGTIWPPPHNALFDFEATARGAEWIDEIASQALFIMRSAGSRVVVGHHDWSAKNMRMGPDGIAVVYDWDAVFLDREGLTGSWTYPRRLQTTRLLPLYANMSRRVGAPLPSWSW